MAAVSTVLTYDDYVFYLETVPHGLQAGIGVGLDTLRQLLRACAVRVHPPDLHGSTAVADEDDRPLERGQI